MEIENTGNIVIDQNLSIYTNSYCLLHSDGVCLQETTVYSLNKNQVKEIGVEIFSVAVAFGFAIGIVVWLIKGLFRLIFPGKGRK